VPPSFWPIRLGTVSGVSKSAPRPPVLFALEVKGIQRFLRRHTVCQKQPARTNSNFGEGAQSTVMKTRILDRSVTPYLRLRIRFKSRLLIRWVSECVFRQGGKTPQLHWTFAFCIDTREHCYYDQSPHL
jgi:hypothetical protein